METAYGENLSAEQMEVVCRGGGVGDLHVDVLVVMIGVHTPGVDHLQEALHTRTRMFRASTVVAVGLQENETSLSKPLGC